MDEKPDRLPQLKLAVYWGLAVLAFGLIGTLAFWLQGPPKMLPVTLAIVGVGLLAVTAGGMQIIWIRRKRKNG